MGYLMRNYFKERNVSFHTFENTASKSKMVELTIKQLLETIARLKYESTEKDGGICCQ